MNYFLEQSIEYANQKNYLDDLYRVYPTIPNGIRSINTGKWSLIEQAFESRNNTELVSHMLDLELFPIKDSYVAYLKRDRRALRRNPATINRLAGRMYAMGLDELYECCSQPKESNRQIGPMWKRYVHSGALGMPAVPIHEFAADSSDAILDASDAVMKSFAAAHLNYRGTKGLDFVARINGRYVIGETKLLSDFGGHQNAQFNDAITVIESPNVDAIQIGILDGVLYIPTNSMMYRSITTVYKDYHIMSALVLPHFLYTL